MYKTAKNLASAGNRSDLYSRVTNEIVKAIEEGAGKYEMPWNSLQSNLLPSNAMTGKHYRGVNILSLWGKALNSGFSSSKWATYKQWHESGCSVRKGEKGTQVVYWDTYLDPELEDEDRPKVFAKGYWVFNANQVEGYEEPEREVLEESPRIANAETFFINLRSDIRHGGDLAAYMPMSDYIRMPEFHQFGKAEGYYSVLAHEHVHWSGHEDRVNRDLTGRFGDEAYALEELIAELGAAFLCGHLGIQTDPRTDHAPYVASWLKVLKSDPKAVFSAASAAQRAVDYLIETSESEPVLVRQGLRDAVLEVFELSAR